MFLLSSCQNCPPCFDGASTFFCNKSPVIFFRNGQIAIITTIKMITRDMMATITRTKEIVAATGTVAGCKPERRDPKWNKNTLCTFEFYNWPASSIVRIDPLLVFRTSKLAVSAVIRHLWISPVITQITRQKILQVLRKLPHKSVLESQVLSDQMCAHCRVDHSLLINQSIQRVGRELLGQLEINGSKKIIIAPFWWQWLGENIMCTGQN